MVARTVRFIVSDHSDGWNIHRAAADGKTECVCELKLSFGAAHGSSDCRATRSIADRLSVPLRRGIGILVIETQDGRLERCLTRLTLIFLRLALPGAF